MPSSGAGGQVVPPPSPDHMAVKGVRMEGRLGQQAQCPFWDVGSVAWVDQQNGGWDVW